MSAALLAGIRSCRAVGGTRSVRCVAALQQPACIQAGARLMSSGTAPPERRKLSMDEVVSFCKRRGFIFPGSELYGSIGTGFDYGPLGAQLKKNIQDAWWKDFVERRPDCVGIESALIMNPRVWEASGHVSLFVDPLTECKSCRKRVRADKLLKTSAESVIAKSQKAAAKASKAAAAAGGGGGAAGPSAEDAARVGLAKRVLKDAAFTSGLSLHEMGEVLHALRTSCPGCGATGASDGLQSPRMFNLLFQTHVGPSMPGDKPTGAAGGSGDSAAAGSAAGKASGAVAAAAAALNPNQTTHAFLRPETAQGVYVNFANVMNSTRRKLPLGIGQVGKSFRNEVAVGNFVFRTREFDQMELQYFCAPDSSPTWFNYWVDYAESWLTTCIGLNPDSVRRKEYEKSELAHYALATTDLEFNYPFGWEELWGIANRGDFDLKAHSEASKVSLQYTDATTKQSFFPHAIEPAVGVNRLLLAVLCDGLWEEPVGTTGDKRTVLRLNSTTAPYKAAVLPVVKNNADIVATATDLHARLLQHVPVEYDETQTVGKRYRRQDEIGTPLCITIDDKSLATAARSSADDDHTSSSSTTRPTVTLRHRDSMQQIRLPVEEVVQRAERGTLTLEALAAVFAAAPPAAAAASGAAAGKGAE